MRAIEYIQASERKASEREASEGEASEREASERDSSDREASEREASESLRRGTRTSASKDSSRRLAHQPNYYGMTSHVIPGVGWPGHVGDVHS